MYRDVKKNNNKNMKKLLFAIIVLFQFQQIQAQIKMKYGITAGINVSSALLPELQLNSIDGILHGEQVVQGNPQWADFVSLYKGGLFAKAELGIASLKLNMNYTKTNIYKDVNAAVFHINALDVDLGYLDFDITFNVNLSKHFYFSAGYVPSFLVSHSGNTNPQSFDQRLLGGFGFKFNNGATIDFDAVVGLAEVIQDSYIHNFMIPITFSLPLNK